MIAIHHHQRFGFPQAFLATGQILHDGPLLFHKVHPTQMLNCPLGLSSIVDPSDTLPGVIGHDRWLLAIRFLPVYHTLLLITLGATW